MRVACRHALGFREGSPLVVGWNPGVVHRPTAAEQGARARLQQLAAVHPAAGASSACCALAHAGPRSASCARSPVQYEPPAQMTPAEPGTLLDEQPDMRDITATLVDLAVRGYLHIEETETSEFFGLFSNKEYVFHAEQAARRAGTSSSAHERCSARGDLRRLRRRGRAVRPQEQVLQAPAGHARRSLYEQLVERRLLHGRPDRVRAAGRFGGIVVGVVIVARWACWIMQASACSPSPFIVAGILVGADRRASSAGSCRRARSRGTRALEKVLGFEEFLSRVEGDRLERVVKTPEMFERFLPFAMAFGVERNWAKAFEGICTSRHSGTAARRRRHVPPVSLHAAISA